MYPILSLIAVRHGNAQPEAASADFNRHLTPIGVAQVDTTLSGTM